MTTVAIEQAQQNLLQLIDDVELGEHVIITRGEVPIAELVPVSRQQRQPVFGSAKGLVKMADDFDSPIDDFQEYAE